MNKMGGTRHTADRDDEAYNILVGKTEGGKTPLKDLCIVGKLMSQLTLPETDMEGSIGNHLTQHQDYTQIVLEKKRLYIFGFQKWERNSSTVEGI